MTSRCIDRLRADALFPRVEDPALPDHLSRFIAGLTAGSDVSVRNRAGRLEPLEAFGTNPGALAGHFYLPPNAPAKMPLVVVLHGCTQSAAAFDRGSGWSELADLGGFAVLFPEQSRENNPNLCFNWFVPQDIARDGGEAQSIRQMVETMLRRMPLDPTRVFVTGLSAGGAMAAAMLATAPDLFAGGAVIAGLPYGCAANVPQAFRAMSGERLPGVFELVERAKAAADRPTNGRYPRLSLWQGTVDRTVVPANAEALAAQWRGLAGLGEAPDHATVDGRLSRSVWLDGEGRPALELCLVEGMDHGTPLKTAGLDACGVAAPFMLDVGISSTCRIARFFGILDPSLTVDLGSRAAAADEETTFIPPGAGAMSQPGAVIENALRKAGLLR